MLKKIDKQINEFLRKSTNFWPKIIFQNDTTQRRNLSKKIGKTCFFTLINMRNSSIDQIELKLKYSKSRRPNFIV